MPNNKLLIDSWKYFINSYIQKRKYDPDISKKRSIYHMIRSLFYIMEAFRQNQIKMNEDNIKTVQSIEKNYLFLNKLIYSNKTICLF